MPLVSRHNGRRRPKLTSLQKEQLKNEQAKQENKISDQKKKTEQEYIMTKLRIFNEEAQRQYNLLITNLPRFESNVPDNYIKNPVPKNYRKENIPNNYIKSFDNFYKV